MADHNIKKPLEIHRKRIIGEIFTKLDPLKYEKKLDIQEFYDNALEYFTKQAEGEYTILNINLNPEQNSLIYPDSVIDMRLPLVYTYPKEPLPEDLEKLISEGMNNGDAFTYVPGSLESLREESMSIDQENTLAIGKSQNNYEEINGKKTKLIKELMVAGENLATLRAYGIGNEDEEFLKLFIDCFSDVLDTFVGINYHLMRGRESRLANGIRKEKEEQEKEKKSEIELREQSQERQRTKSIDQPGVGYTVPSRLNDTIGQMQFEFDQSIGIYGYVNESFRKLFGEPIESFYNEKEREISLFNGFLVDQFCKDKKYSNEIRENAVLAAMSLLTPTNDRLFKGADKQSLFDNIERSTNLLELYVESKDINFTILRKLLKSMDNIIGNSQNPLPDFLELSRRYSTLVLPSNYGFGGQDEFKREYPVKHSLYRLPTLLVNERKRSDKNFAKDNKEKRKYGWSVVDFIQNNLVPIVCEEGYNYKEEFKDFIQSSNSK